MKRYVVFFTAPFPVKGQHRLGGRTPRTKVLTVRTAKGPIDAYRKATGWKGKISAGKGYSPQTPARQLMAYVHFENMTSEEWQAKFRAAPPVAYVVPLGKW